MFFWDMMLPAIAHATTPTVNPAMPAIITTGFGVLKTIVRAPYAIVRLCCSPIVVLYKRNKMLVFFLFTVTLLLLARANCFIEIRKAFD